MTNFDQRLRDAGISSEDVETQIQSTDTALLLTAREIVLLEPYRVQRGRLRDITGVKIVKTGELSVRSAVESMIEGNVLGFEKTERKLFFDAVKDATARAKAGVTNATLPPLPVSSQALSSETMPPETMPPQTMSSESLGGPALKSSADDWQALMGAPDAQNTQLSSTAASAIADFEALTQPSHSAAPDPFSLQPIAGSEPDLAPNINQWDRAPGSDAPDPDASDDPWKSSKQTFEVEPEKPASPADPWVEDNSDPSSRAPAQSWNDPFAANSAVGVAPLAAVTAVQTGSDGWGGDLLEANKSLSGPLEKSDLERKVSVLGGDNTSTLQACSRWLKIFAVVFFFSGAAFTVTLLPANTSNILGYLVLLSAFFGSVLFSLIAWGLGELLSAYAISMQDLKAIRRATLGH